MHSLYGVFGGRDELLRAIFETYSPLLDVEKVVAGPRADLDETVRATYRLMDETVRATYRLMAEALTREPRVMPAMLAEALARPDEPALQGLLQHFAPRMLAGLGQWLTDEMEAGRIRRLPLPLLIQQMIAPALMHFVSRPAAETVFELPGVEETCEVFAAAFLNAAAVRLLLGVIDWSPCSAWPGSAWAPP
ncbi:hypothetical protein Nocox_21940 [Nonomuraea coxensis DSM 45129]|uniref:TetR family transcriptional regulator n=1 Tax=Nonomuraea coxensis DSM 45129 TaxID=1122611 RepID=A0ABX8U2M7_9ACTN|nr:hypothetical protein [Nonomuraea coxensis]QYC41992.1 hypothetical protein Nocox_21940 [Nonomuraea coxensis DSM 45129]